MKHRNLTYELVTRLSRQYSSRFEFQKGDKAAYNKALKEGWIESYTWLGVPVRKIHDSLDRVHVVYAYLDEENKVAYIGRTNNIRKRHSQHNRLSYKYKKYDVVKQYFISIGMLDKLPDPFVVETGLTLIESQEKEDYYINEYRSNGWKILNRGKTGANISSTGSYVIKWTYDNCKDLALSCKTRKEFETKSPTAYAVSKEKGWIDKWLPVSANYHEAEYSWTKELCVEKAKKYTSFPDFRKQEPQAYNAALRRGWLKELNWLIKAKRTDITKDEILQLAKGYKYASDFKKAYPSHYHCAIRLGVLKELAFEVKDTRKWTYDTCHAEALKYSTQIEFRKASPVAYNVSLSNGWINDWLPKTIIIRSNGELLEEAKKFKTINDLRRSDNSLYCLILTRGLLEQTGLQYLRKQWTKEKVREEAARYNTRLALQKGSKGAYNYALKNKLIDELFPKTK